MKMFQRLFCWLILMTSWITSRCQNYYCEISPAHTLCVNRGLGQSCTSNVPFRGVSLQQGDLIVTQINRLRSRVALGRETRGDPGPQPMASNMMVMNWDDELAAVAQSHADQCLFRHDCQACRKVSRFGVGQTLFTTQSFDYRPRIEWSRAVNAWYNEVNVFDPTSIYPFGIESPMRMGHYTQLMWWNSVRIGCGFTMSRSRIGLWIKLYTCNYGPGGNILSQRMYQRGLPCTACPFGTFCSIQYLGLCDVLPFLQRSGIYPEHLNETFLADLDEPSTPHTRFTLDSTMDSIHSDTHLEYEQFIIHN